MKPSELKTYITSRFNASIKRPIHIESSPGVGKTQIAAQCAAELGVDFRCIHAPLMQPEDYGFPVISKERDNVSFIVSKDRFPVVNSSASERGILLIDELPQADNGGQKILSQLMQEREIHGVKLMPGWQIVSTGNRSTDRAGANRLLSHLRNRVTTVSLEASLDDWSTWAIQNGVKPEIVAFIRFRPALLNAFDPQAEINATPRAWVEGVNACLGTVDPSLEYESFRGDVGEGPAAEFSGFLKIFRKLPSVDAILLDPKRVAVPSDSPATLYALSGALAARTTAANFGRVMEYIERMPSEFSVLYVRDALKRDLSIQASKEFITWASGPGAKLLT